MENVVIANDSNFDEIIKENQEKLIVVDFFADWCMPCVMMGPVFERLAEKNKQAKFCKINVDDASKIAQDYEISSIPCIIFFKDGQEVDRITGGLSEDLFQEKISDYLRL